MSPTHTRKAGRLYRYYTSQTALKRGGSDCPVRQVPAAEIDRIVIDQIRLLLQAPEIVVRTWRAARKQDQDVTESDLRAALTEFDKLCNELFPAEQARIVELLVERIDLNPDKLDVTLRIEGLTSLYGEMRGQPAFQEAAERQNPRGSPLDASADRSRLPTAGPWWSVSRFRFGARAAARRW